MSSAFFADLAREAAARYPPGDRFARAFAHGKLARDPAFRYMLEEGLLHPGASILDLGAGQGVLGALLAAAATRCDWPESWPPAPKGTHLRGIEMQKRDVDRARAASFSDMEMVHGDIRTAPFGVADVCVLLDVLHYLDAAAQDDVLMRVRAALSSGGVLLLRIADPARGLRFAVTLAADRCAMALRGRFFKRYHCRPLDAWRQALERLGFEVQAVPMSGGTPFANVLLVARYDPSPRHPR